MVMPNVLSPVAYTGFRKEGAKIETETSSELHRYPAACIQFSLEIRVKIKKEKSSLNFDYHFCRYRY